MPRIRLAAASLGLALVASTVGVGATAEPADAGVLGCLGSTLVLVADLQTVAQGAVGNDLANIKALVSELLTDVATVNVAGIVTQAQFVISEAAANLITVPASTLAAAENVLSSCQSG
jgi:hypothetical protein